jgi:hypothetical protein
MRHRRLALALALAAPLVACSGASTEPPIGRSAAAETVADPTITFTAGWTESTTPLVAGEQAQVSYDPARLPTCRGNLGYGTGPSWSINAYTQVNGIAFNQPLGIAGASLANLGLPAGALPSFTLPFAGTLQLWFENSDAFGCNAWDSDYGANYSFTIAPPANAPGWVSGASYLLDRATCDGGPCYADAQSADGGLTFDTLARQQAAITQVFFDVWQAGVTDVDNPDLWQQLDVESHRRADPTQTFTMAYVTFSERTGNNARYALDLRALDLLPGNDSGALTSATQCPAIPATITADGQYVQADLEIFFTVNGVAVQPAGGGPFHVLFQNYAGLYAICAYPHAT